MPKVGASAPWRVNLLGRFELLLGGEAVPEAALGSRKQRRLLKLLLLERGRSVATERIVELLWDAPPERGDRQVATLVSRLRAALGREAIQGGPGSYRIRLPDDSSVDLDEAEQLAREALERWEMSEASMTRAAASRAVHLLERGIPLEEEPYAEWVEGTRAQAARLLSQARSLLWRSALTTADHQAAIEAASGAIAADPLDEEAYRALMRAYSEAGAGPRALAVYRRLGEVLAEELGVDPAPETAALNAAIAAGRRPTFRDAPDRQLSAEPSPREAPDPTFVGREEELSALTAAWRAAVAGDGGALLLVGEAGIGKSTLARRLVTLARSTGGLVLESRCFDAERSLFLQPVAEALRPLVMRSDRSDLRKLAGDVAAGLSRLLPEFAVATDLPDPEPLTPELEYRRAFGAVVQLLRRLSSRQPVLLFLDDLHNAGLTTIELLHYTLRATLPRLLLVATVRVEEGEEPLRVLGELARRLEVGPLPAADARRLAAAMGGQAVADELLERAGGHPLFLVEMLRGLSDQPAADSGTAIPTTLRSAVLDRVARAGEGVTELLAAAAVLGPRFDVATVAAVADVSVEAAARRAERAHRARLLSVVGNDFSFSNDLIHEILYAATPPPIRAARHRTAAQLFAGRPELVGHHASAAGAWPEAAVAWRAAAAEAVSAFANRDAEGLLDLALEAARQAGLPELVAEALLDRCLVRERLARYPEAFDDCAAARELARDIGHRGLEMRALREMGGDPSIALGRSLAACVPYLEEALEIADEIGEHAAAVDILRRLAILEVNRLRGRPAREHADAAVRRAREVGDGLALEAALDGRKTVAAYTGDVTTLAEVTRELKPMLERRQQLWVLQWTVFESAMVPFAAGDWAAARQLVEQALELSVRSGYHAYQPMFLAQRAWIEQVSGILGAALQTGSRAVELAAAENHPWWVGFASASHGGCLVSIGAYQEALPVLELGLKAIERDGADLHVLRCLGPLAEATAHLGQSRRAATLAGRVEALARQSGDEPPFLHAAHGLLGAGRAWLRLAEPQRAEALFRQVAVAAEKAGWCEPLALAKLGLAEAFMAQGDEELALSGWRQALSATERTDMPGVAAEACSSLAKALREQRPSEAEAHAAVAARLHAELRDTLTEGAHVRAFDRLVARRLAEET